MSIGRNGEWEPPIIFLYLTFFHSVAVWVNSEAHVNWESAISMPFKITIWLHGLTKLPGWPCTVHPSVPTLERVGTTELLCCIWHPQTLKLHMASPRVCSPYTLTNELPHSAHAVHASPVICCAHSPCCLHCPHDCPWCPYIPCYSSYLYCLSCSGSAYAVVHSVNISGIDFLTPSPVCITAPFFILKVICVGWRF